MTYYLDADYRVHVTPAEGITPWEDADGLFTGKCRAYIEGFRVVPAGQTWTRPDGVAFAGEMVCAVTDARVLLAAQGAYEQATQEAALRYAEYDAALVELAGLIPAGE